MRIDWAAGGGLLFIKLIADAITSPDSSHDGANSWLMFWDGAPAQPAIEHSNEVTTTTLPV